MPFKSAKRQSGQSLAGSTGRSNSQRVSNAGGSGMRHRKRGAVPPLAVISVPVVSALLATTLTLTITTSTLKGTMYMIVDPNVLEPSAAQIKAGLEQAGGAADFDGSKAVGAKSMIFEVTGLIAATQYDAWFVQETEAGDSNISNVQFTTAV